MASIASYTMLACASSFELHTRSEPSFPATNSELASAEHVSLFVFFLAIRRRAFLNRSITFPRSTHSLAILNE